MKKYFFLLSIFLIFCRCDSNKASIKVGSKVFTESYILAEIISEILEQTGEAEVSRKFGLGATGIIYKAIVRGDVDIYPEYSGTISETILNDSKIKSLSDIRVGLKKFNLTVGDSLGFNNTYALAVRTDVAEKNHLKTYSDLARHPNIIVGFSHEFMKRPDGYPGLQSFYSLELSQVTAMQHTLAYQALSNQEIEMTDVYSTDAEIELLRLKVLEDDRHFFPTYLAVILARSDFESRYPKSWKALKNLEGKISEKQMTHMNAEVEIEKKTFAAVASEFLMNKKDLRPRNDRSELISHILHYTKQHINLVLSSLIFSIIVGLPLGIVAARNVMLGQIILIFSSILQTIPSMALLCFLIPLFGIGTVPSLVALFLYGLLPIVLGTFTGIKSLDWRLKEAAQALGLSPWKKLRLIEIPLASPQILAGIKTSAIINIGTATLAALIGAGGYGSPIITGLALNDMPTILQGAIPAAIMAFLVHGIFEVISHMVIPRGIEK